MIKSDKEKYWGDRAAEYSHFKWANDREYLNEFLNACEFGRDDYVLDLGCGTGLVTKEIAMFVRRVIGLDNSKEMLNQCDGNFNLMIGDARDNPFPDEVFDRVIARNIFHHMTNGIMEGLKETHRVLKTGGRLIVGERVPPSDEVLDEYKEIMKLKDNRIVFTEEKLRGFIMCLGFKVIKSFPVWIKEMSVRGWLNKSGLSDGVKMEIFRRHYNGSDEFKKAHHLEERVNSNLEIVDCIINIKNIVVVAEKQ